MYIYTSHTHAHPAIRKNEILALATMWMDLEGIVLSEISQTEKDKYCMISHVESTKFNKLVNKAKKQQIHCYRMQTSGYQRGEGKRGGTT